MATFGEALEALEEFRTSLVEAQVNASIQGSEAMAFREGVADEAESPFGSVHATGVGVRGDVDAPGEQDFVIKVYVFGTTALQPAIEAMSSRSLRTSRQGVEVDVERLPIQFAFAKKKRIAAAAAANPPQHQRRHRPVPAGVEIGPLGGNFVGTLGCFVRRGTGANAPLFALSNNHVLADVNRFQLGTRFTQPFSSSATNVVLTLSDFEPIRFPSPGSQPRNVIDAAIASVADPAQVRLGRMLNIGNYKPTLLAPRPGMTVTKAGRTTGVTTGVIRAIRVRGVQVNFGTRQNPVLATFDNAITIRGTSGTRFSNSGDSGSVILEKQSGRPVALLFAGDGVNTTACDFAAACARFGVLPV